MRERWLSRRAVFLHLGCLLFVPFCLAATWWQITRAQDGNGLSYLYTFEWPVFAIVGVYFWWQFLHTDYEAVGLRGMRNHEAAQSATTNDSTRAIDRSDDDPELAAYNARLGALTSTGGKTWRKPEASVARRRQ